MKEREWVRVMMENRGGGGNEQFEEGVCWGNGGWCVCVC